MGKLDRLRQKLFKSRGDNEVSAHELGKFSLVGA